VSKISRIVALSLTKIIGNLPFEQVTKRDLFYAFYQYGRLAQVSIKQAYGFVQFHDVAACQRALKGEQGQEIRGRKMCEFFLRNIESIVVLTHHKILK
jgi:RNA recognition motif-containing protein